MATGGGQTSGVGGAEPGCADPNAGVGWAGDWGQMLTHGCIESPGLPDPVTFDISDAGHDCETITADVWVPGITDADADPALIRAQVWTDVGSASPPLKEASALHFVRRVGNNYRYSWAPYLPVVSPGDYELWFRFSVGDENQGCWYLIGTGEGPGGGAARTAHVVP